MPLTKSILLLAVLIAMPLSAKKTVEDKSSYSTQVIEGITPNYTQWETAEINGKIHMDKLPVTPKAKIYMKRGEIIDISVRASFLGEVGRIRVTPDSVIAVNKMKKVYCSESLGLVSENLPTALSEFQTLLLGRVNVFGIGELSAENINELTIESLAAQAVDGSVSAEISDTSDPAWQLSGILDFNDNADLQYVYYIFPDGRVNAVDLKVDAIDIELAMASRYSKKERDMAIMFAKEGKVKFETMLTLDYPQWEAAEPAPINLGSKYRQVTLTQFLQSF